MQTGIKLFDFLPKASSIDGRQVLPGTTKLGDETATDQLTGFMQIMSALMALPPEQWETSLAKLDSISLEGESAHLDSMIDVNRKGVQAAALLQMLFDLNGPIQKALQNKEAQDTTHQLLDMAKTVLNGPEKIDSACGDICLDELKTSGAHMDNANSGQIVADDILMDEITAPSPLGKTVQNPISANDLSAGKDLFDVTGKAVDKPRPESLPDSEFDAEPGTGDDSVLESTSFEKIVKKLSQQSSARKDVFSKAAENQSIEAKTQNEGDQKQQVTDGTSKHFSPEKPVAVELQSVGDGDDLGDNSLKLSSASSGEHQGLLSRADAKHETSMVQASAAKEGIPQDKEMQADIIRQIVQRMSMHTQGTQSRMNIRLQPEFLGDVHMQILTENHQVTVRMMTDSLAVKEIIQQNLQHLRSELQYHGLEIQKFDVFVGNDNQGWKNGQDQAAFKENLHQRQQRFGGSKTKRQDDMAVTDAGHRRIYTQRNLNEIDYFA